MLWGCLNSSRSFIKFTSFLKLVNSKYLFKVFDVFFVNFEKILHVALVFPRLTLNKQMPAGIEAQIEQLHITKANLKKQRDADVLPFFILE